jgi:hypothetical protein
MTIALKPLALAGVLAFAGVTSASAALLDFTDSSVGFPAGSIGGVTYTVTGVPIAPKLTVGAPGPIDVLAGETDGIGIRNDEITFPGEYVVIEFSKAVTIRAAYFLDLFFKAGSGGVLIDSEQANITVGAVPGAIDAFLVAQTADNIGFGALTGLSLKGTTFTFFAGPGQDDSSGDFALAALDVAPIPLPAGALLIGTAFGAFGLLRRRKRA